MRIVSFTEARNSLKAMLDSVVTDADTAVINPPTLKHLAHYWSYLTAPTQ